MPLRLEEFARESFQGYIENVPLDRQRPLARFMPAKPIFDTRFAYNVINGRYARTASITGFNAGAPLREKRGLEKAFGKVAKVQHAFHLDEEDLIAYAQARTDEEAQQIIDEIYDQTDELIEGVRDIEEWMRGQAIYNGRLVYSENGVALDIDFGVPSANKLALVGTALFSDRAASDPLTILRERHDQFKGVNRQRAAAEMHMSSAVFNDLISNAAIRENVFGNTTDRRIVTKDALDSLFVAVGLPPIVINDDVVEMESGIVRVLPERRIVFLAEDLGDLMQGITIENNTRPGMYVLTEIKETNPPSQSVFVGETVFPALKKIEGVSFLDV